MCLLGVDRVNLVNSSKYAMHAQWGLNLVSARTNRSQLRLPGTRFLSTVPDTWIVLSCKRTPPADMVFIKRWKWSSTSMSYLSKFQFLLWNPTVHSTIQPDYRVIMMPTGWIYHLLQFLWINWRHNMAPVLWQRWVVVIKAMVSVNILLVSGWL